MASSGKGARAWTQIAIEKDAFWIITLTVGTAVLAALYVLVARDANNTTARQLAGSIPSSPEHANPVQTPSPGPSLKRPTTMAMATVFECHVNGQRIYSDRRCGSTAEDHPIQAPNRTEAEDTSILLSPEEVLARSRSEQAYADEATVSPPQAECSRIEDEKNSIDARLRPGYTAPEGERLRDRLRFVSARTPTTFAADTFVRGRA